MRSAVFPRKHKSEKKKRKDRVCKIFVFVKLILFLKAYEADGQWTSNQIVGSLLIPPGWKSRLGKWAVHGPIAFNRLQNLTNSDITQ